MMKSVFDEDGKYTDVATLIEGRISQALEQIMSAYVSLGYSHRDIVHLMIHAAVDVGAATAVRYVRARQKKQEGEP